MFSLSQGFVADTQGFCSAYWIIHQSEATRAAFIARRFRNSSQMM